MAFSKNFFAKQLKRYWFAGHKNKAAMYKHGCQSDTVITPQLLPC